MDCIIIRTGKYFNYTYASTRWDAWGTPTDYEILICSCWQDGFQQARNLGKKSVLFLDSGTVFNDINDFVKKIRSYPHQGLIGHIIDPLDTKKFYSLHPQCFLMDVQNFDIDMFDDGVYQAPTVERSGSNIHDNYTPLWLKSVPGDYTPMYQDKFGQKILARQLSQGKIVSNWHQKLRDNKIYLYRNDIRDSWIQKQQSYIDMAEQHLWILNNQLVDRIDVKHLISPASGVFWMAGSDAETIDLVDISQWQIALVENLINHWDGHDYGSFVRDFVIKNKIKHLQFDVAMEQADKVKLLVDKDRFCEYVNSRFREQIQGLGIDPGNFSDHWDKVRRKKITLHLTNMVNYLLKTDLGPDYGVWLSNILDYKYTWVKSTAEQIQICREYLTDSCCHVRT